VVQFQDAKRREVFALAQQLADTDPYDHPRGIHNVNSPNDAYIDAARIDFTAIQTRSPGTRCGLQNSLQHNQIALDWIRRCEARNNLCSVY
jgi:hypothetical protein